MKRRRLIFVVCLVLVVVVIGYKIIPRREPKYQGIGLSRWFVRYYTRQSAEDEKEALEAIRAMGTNAVPFLLKQCFSREKDSAVWSNTVAFLEKMDLPIKVPRYISVETIREAAAKAVEEIQPPGSLILPVATNALAGTNRFDRLFGVFLLGTMSDDRELAAPWLARNLQSTDQIMVAVSLRSIGRLGMPMAGIAPDMIQLLTNRPGSSWLIWVSCEAFAGIGSNAVPAIPILKQEFLQSTNFNLRTNIAATLCRIDPAESGPLHAVVDEMMQTNTVSARIELAKYLSSVGFPAATNGVGILLPMVTDSRLEVACAAAAALRNMGVEHNQVSGLLQGALVDPREEVRFNAAKTMVAFDPGDAAAQEVFLDFIRQGSARQIGAMNELGQLGSGAKRALPVLWEASTNQDRYIHGAAQSAIQMIRTQKAEPWKVKE